MPERSQKLALALLSSLLVLSTGCTSSRILKPNGFGWLGDKGDTRVTDDSLDFPPPSSAEVPRSLQGRRAHSQASAIAGTTPNLTPSAASHAQAINLPAAFAGGNSDHSMVQNGLYGPPASHAVATTPVTAPAPTTIAPPSAASIPDYVSGPTVTAPATQLASVPTTAPTVAPVNHERSMYETENDAPDYLASAATYTEPVAPAPQAIAATAIAPITPTAPITCLLYTSPSPRDATLSRMPSSA